MNVREVQALLNLMPPDYVVSFGDDNTVVDGAKIQHVDGVNFVQMANLPGYRENDSR